MLKYTKMTYQRKRKGNPRIKLPRSLIKVFIDGQKYNLVKLGNELSTERDLFYGQYEIMARMGKKYYKVNIAEANN